VNVEKKKRFQSIIILYLIERNH